jgi:hypothetical protein
MNSNNLTVFVKDTHNNLVKGADVSIDPGNITGKTNEKGQVTLSLPAEKKVTVTVKLNDISQKVPYYLTGQKNNRLEINLAYFQQIQTQSPTKIATSSSKKTNHWSIFIILIVITLVILSIFQLTKKKQC